MDRSENKEPEIMQMRRALILLAGVSFAGFAQSSQTLTGTVSDSMCGAKHMMANLSAAQCTRECVKQGSDYALVVNGKVYTLKGDAKQIDQYAGQNVTVTGSVSGDTVTVKSISAAKS
jgi:hypothetical protein